MTYINSVSEENQMPEENKNFASNEDGAPEEQVSTREIQDSFDVGTDNSWVSAEEMQHSAENVGDTNFCEECDSGEKDKKKIKKKKLRISLRAFLLSSVALVLATVMLTYSICAEFFREKYVNSVVKGEEVIVDGEPQLSEFDLLNAYIDKYYYGDADKEKMMDAALKAYVAATGDVYATYYTLEELLENREEDAGRMSGIGVNIVNDEFEYNGSNIKCLHIYNVVDGSPAEKAGVRRGDLLVYVGTGDAKQSVNDLGYEKALELLLGEVGTAAEFTVCRKSDNSYSEIEFSDVIRGDLESTSVMADVYEKDSSVGILTITDFNYTTPSQFEKKLEALKADGCSKFVIDLRYNPGGLLVSIQAVLSYFLNENDVFIQTKDSNGNIQQLTVKPVDYQQGDAIKCNVDADDIGKYRNLDLVVLCNKGTASAAELFVANMKDYGLAKIVGVNTFGKGKMQDTFLLNYGLNGAVKLTTHMYFSGGDSELVGYDGVGIVPDLKVELSEEAAQYFPYILPQALDGQLIAAVGLFN